MGYGDLLGITLEKSDQISILLCPPSLRYARSRQAGPQKRDHGRAGRKSASHASQRRVSTAGSGASALRPFAGGLSTSSATGDETHFCPIPLPRKTPSGGSSVPDAAQRSFAFAEGPPRRGTERAICQSHRGEMTKTVLSILRQAAEPMTTRDIALEMLVTRALDKDDQKLLALMTKRVGVTLRLQRLNAVVRSSSGPGQFMLWEIAR
jgi:hypothetical protein